MRTVMGETKKTIKDRTLDYLKEFGSITSLEAIRDIGNTRLSGTIYNLRKEGHKIRSVQESAKNRWGFNTYFARYYLVDEEEKETNESEI